MGHQPSQVSVVLHCSALLFCTAHLTLHNTTVRLADGSMRFDEEHDALHVPHLIKLHPQLKQKSSFAMALTPVEAAIKLPAGGGGIICTFGCEES